MQKKEEEKNANHFVFQYYDNAFQPELSSPARFRIQGGSSEPDGGGGGRTNGNPREGFILVLYLTVIAADSRDKLFKAEARTVAFHQKSLTELLHK